MEEVLIHLNSRLSLHDEVVPLKLAVYQQCIDSVTHGKTLH